MVIGNKSSILILQTLHSKLGGCDPVRSHYYSRGVVNEAFGFATHTAVFPQGRRSTRFRPRAEPQRCLRVKADLAPPPRVNVSMSQCFAAQHVHMLQQMRSCHLVCRGAPSVVIRNVYVARILVENSDHGNARQRKVQQSLLAAADARGKAPCSFYRVDAKPDGRILQSHSNICGCG